VLGYELMFNSTCTTLWYCGSSWEQPLAEMEGKTVYIRPKVVRPFPDPMQVGATCTGLPFFLPFSHWCLCGSTKKQLNLELSKIFLQGNHNVIYHYFGGYVPIKIFMGVHGQEYSISG
jgi:hypothetical protein